VLDVVVGGDDEDVALLDLADPQAMRAEPDQRTQLAMFAAGSTAQLERVRPLDDILRSAAAVDPVAAELRADIQLRQRRAAMRTVVSWIAAHGPLRNGMSETEAAAIVWTLTSPEVHLMLRDTFRRARSDSPELRPHGCSGTTHRRPHPAAELSERRARPRSGLDQVVGLLVTCNPARVSHRSPLPVTSFSSRSRPTCTSDPSQLSRHRSTASQQLWSSTWPGRTNGSHRRGAGRRMRSRLR
jgi:hypothetical protein